MPGAGAERDCRVLLVLPKIHSVGSARSPGGGSIPPGYPQSPFAGYVHSSLLYFNRVPASFWGAKVSSNSLDLCLRAPSPQRP